MARAPRLACMVAALATAGCLLSSTPQAVAEIPAAEPLDGPEAVALALETGEPVVATELTDEHTLVTADPETGLLTAELSAQVARVSDGDGGWREPSATLIAGPDGAWVAEASVLPVSIAGGDGAFLTLGEGDAEASFSWPETLPVPSVSDNLATFAEVAPGVDLVVRAAVDGAETYLVVKDAAAAQEPLVRSVPISIEAPGLERADTESGGISFLDEAGDERIAIPPAYLWDLAGQPEEATVADLLDAAEGAQVVALPVEDAVAARGGAPLPATFAMSEEALALLDDPATVYPVVIDPSATVQSYAVRVTQDFNKYNSDIGSRAKLGYNGWSSPYYKSRMYYQFRWPRNADESLISAAQVRVATFHFVQTHSAQHNCSDNDFGPSVKLQFHNTISSDTTWSNQPGVHSSSGSVSNDYAVGHEDVCKKTYTQKWIVSSGVTSERTNYATRTTVTIGLRSNDEADKNGWREYKHSSGTSPKLDVVYEPEPPTPTGFSISNGAPSNPLVARAANIQLRANVALASGFSCGQTNCLQAEFTVYKGTTLVKNATLSAGWQPGSALPPFIPINGLTDGSYTVHVRAFNNHTGLYSINPATFTFSVDLPPGAPTWSWDKTDWNDPFTVPASKQLAILVSGVPADHRVCVQIDDVNVDLDPQPNEVCGVPATGGRINLPALPATPYGQSTKVAVALKDAHSAGAWSVQQVTVA